MFNHWSNKVSVTTKENIMTDQINVYTKEEFAAFTQEEVSAMSQEQIDYNEAYHMINDEFDYWVDEARMIVGHNKGVSEAECHEFMFVHSSGNMMDGMSEAGTDAIYDEMEFIMSNVYRNAYK